MYKFILIVLVVLLSTGAAIAVDRPTNLYEVTMHVTRDGDHQGVRKELIEATDTADAENIAMEMYKPDYIIQIRKIH